MPKFAVSLENVVFTVVEVEAEDEDSAIEEALLEGVPGLMFLDHRYPDEGDWEAVAAYRVDE